MWAIAGGHAITHTYPAAFALLVPFLARDLGLTFSQIGVLVALRQAMSTVVNLPAGMIVDTMGKRNLLMGLALAWASVPYLVVAATSSYWLMLLCMVIVGIGVFLWHPAAITSISEFYPSQRGYGLALHELGANLGDTLAPVAAGALLVYLSWRQVLAANVALGLVVVFVIVRLLAHLHRQRTEVSTRGRSVKEYMDGLRALVRNANLLMLALVSGIRSLTQNGLSTFLPLYLVYELRLPGALVGLYLAVMQASGMVATPLAGTLSDRVGPKRVATTGMMTTSLIVLAFAFLDLGAAFVAVLALMGFFLYSMRPAMFRWALGVVPREYEGTAVGALFTTQATFSTLMPLIGGFLADRFGLLSVFYFVAGAVLVGNLALLAVPDLRSPAQTGPGGG
jgi:MFS family permease